MAVIILDDPEPETGLFLKFTELMLALLIIFGGSTPFLFQAYKMYGAKSIKGFSTFTSLILVLANVIRVYWWIIERFQIVIMLAAVA